MLLIDTYNVLHTVGVLPPHLAGLDAPGLAELIARSRYAGREVRLVCDGAPKASKSNNPRAPGFQSEPPRRAAGAAITYAGPGKHADDVIEHILRTDSGARRILVVSSDRRLRKAARRRKASSIPSEGFLRQLAFDEAHQGPDRITASAPAIPLDPYSVAHWMAEFGYAADPATLVNRAGAEGPAPPIASNRARVDRAGVGGKGAGGSTPPGPIEKTPLPASRTPDRPPSTLLPPGEQIDPMILDALEVWSGRLTLADLDMNQWLTKGPEIPARPDDRPPPGPRSRRRPRS